MNYCTQTQSDPFTEITSSITNLQNQEALPIKPTNFDSPEQNPEYFKSQKTKGLVNYIFKKDVPCNDDMLGTSMDINVLNGTEEYVDNETGEQRVKGTYLPMNERIKQRIIGEENYEPNYEVLSLEEIYSVLDQLQVKYSRNAHKSYLLNQLKKYEINDYLKFN